MNDSKPNETDSPQFDHYKILSKRLLSQLARNDERIFLHALTEIMSGYTAEEAVMHSYLFDIALQVKMADEDIEKIMAIFSSIVPVLEIFKKWKDSGLIKEDLWKNDTRAIYKVAVLDPSQPEWLEVVLRDLNRLPPK